MADKDKKWMLFGGLAMGAAALYFLDPDLGQKRREEFGGRLKRYGTRVAEETSKSARDVWNRVSGKGRQIWSKTGQEPADDIVVVERIRSRMGKIVSHPHKIHVACDGGIVTLWGAAPEEEMRHLLRILGSIQGVNEVWNHIETEEQTDKPVSQAASLNRARKAVALNWSPAKRAMVGSAGAATAIYGLKRRDQVGVGLSVLGGSLMAASLMRKNLGSMLSLSDGSPGFELQETIRVNAPISDIYDFWLNPRNYPKVFSHIDDVEQVGENLYRWSLTGPAGIPIRWDGSITEAVPNTLIEWKSLPGATVGNFGMVRFDPNYDASTRVHVRMFYHPPAGILGRIFAELLGANPKKVLHEDLKRMKLLFESDETLLKELNANDLEQLLKTAGC